ncbi:hypothetical protein ASG52_14070 [Methylobacterium sp. Leaf456]|nr:hypothetical protein ASG52_14070 [Methylobacterium sp. Leaf456]
MEFVRKGECKIFVWGRVNYRDAFDQERFFSFKAYNEGAQTMVAPDRTSTYLVFGVSPARNGYQAN